MFELRAIDRLPRRAIWPALAFAVLIGSMSRVFSARYGLPALPGDFGLGQPHKVWQVLAAACVVYAVLGAPWLSAALKTKPMRFLGRISFAIYLVHAPLALTVFAPVFLAVRGIPIGMVGLFLAFIACVILVGWVFNIYDEWVVDRIRVAKRFCRAATQR